MYKTLLQYSPEINQEKIADALIVPSLDLSTMERVETAAEREAVPE